MIFYRPIVIGNPSRFILEGQLVGDLKFNPDNGFFSTQEGVNLSYFQNENAQAKRIQLYYTVRAVNEYGQSAPFPVILNVENHYGGRLPALVDRISAELPAIYQGKVGEKIDLKLSGVKRVISGRLPPGVKIDENRNIVGIVQEKGKWEALIKIGAERNAYNTGWAKPHPYSERVSSIAFMIGVDSNLEKKEPLPLSPAVTSASNLEYLSTQADAGIMLRLVNNKYV
jgi:hypothetical protein